MWVYIDVAQGSDDWHKHRCGSLGASQVHEALSKTKTGWGAGRANIKARMVAERLTGLTQETFKSSAMQWGNDTEPQARSAYEFITGKRVQVVGMFKLANLDGSHASPDGLVDNDGLIEIKCPNTATHIETLKTEKIDPKYITQMQWQMALTDREWCDFVSYDPRMPEDLSLFIKRVPRDPQMIADLMKQVEEFLGEVDADIKALEEIRKRRQ